MSSGRCITAATRGYDLNGVAFNRDGTVLTSADGDGNIRLWNPTARKQIGTTITPRTIEPTAVEISLMDSVAFNPAGTILATADSDGRTKLISTSRQIDADPLLCREFGLSSPAIWSQYTGTSLAEPAKCL